MKILRSLLFPFSVMYQMITSFRNFLFDCGILTSQDFETPVISVGNLSTGGTGKTPQIEYLIRLLENDFNVAVLSRGYKRKSKGFVLANQQSTVADLGDEPFQYHQKFKNIRVAVDANRRRGIRNIEALRPKPEVILLDDAFQHRYVKPHVQILLTTYDDPFFSDFMLPTGNLREQRSGAKRADLVVVTKCPQNLSDAEKEEKIRQIKHYVQAPVFFSFIDYGEHTAGDKIYQTTQLASIRKTIFTGIANPEPFLKRVKAKEDVVFRFADHHQLSRTEIGKISETAKPNFVLTTEKDYVRVRSEWTSSNLCFLPIEVNFLGDQKKFDQLIIQKVKSILSRSLA